MNKYNIDPPICKSSKYNDNGIIRNGREENTYIVDESFLWASLG